MAIRRWARVRIDNSNLRNGFEFFRKNMMEFCIEASGLDPTKTVIVRQEPAGFDSVYWTFQEIELPSASRT